MYRVLQVASSTGGWRGADNQVCLLANGLATDTDSYVLAAPGHVIFARLNSAVHKIPLRIGNGFNLPALFKFIHLCRQKKIDLIDFHSSHGHNFAMLIRQLLPRTKIIVHRHTNFSPSDNILSRYKYLHSGIDHYICVSQAVRNTLLRYGVASHRTSTILGATPLRIYSVAEKKHRKEEICRKYNLDYTKPLLGTAAALLEQKGYFTLLQGLKILKEKNTPYQAILCGEGEDRAKIEQLCIDYGLQNEVRLLGFVTDIASTLAAVDVFCFPSTGEGLGIAVQEAVYAGCCVVATAVGGIGEMITHNHSGLLTKVGNEVELAVNLEQALVNKTRREKLAVNALQEIKTKFSAKSMVVNTKNIYENLLSKDLRN